MKLTVSELGALMLLLFGLFHWLGIFGRIRAVLAFLGAAAVVGSGTLGGWLSTAASWAQHAFGSVANWAIGVPLAVGLAVIVSVIVAHDLHPKHSAGKRTGLLAFVLGAFIAAGVAGIPALHGLHDGIMHLLGGTAAALNSAER